MKQIKFFFAFLVSVVILGSCANVYKSPELEARISKHKKIAFLPFDAVIRYTKMPENTSIEQIKEMEKDMGYVFQEQIYVQFLNKSTKFNIEFQDVARTNALLLKNNINYSNFKEFTKDEISKILNVDAIVSGKILTSQPMSTTEAIDTKLYTDNTNVATNKIDVNVSLYDGSDSKLLFKYDHSYSGGIGSSPEQLSKMMMRSIGKKFPYRKK